MLLCSKRCWYLQRTVQKFVREYRMPHFCVLIALFLNIFHVFVGLHGLPSVWSHPTFKIQGASDLPTQADEGRDPTVRTLLSDVSQYLAICVIAKDQRADIDEWIDYHALQGVGKFYVYDDDSRPSLQPMLQHRIDSGLVVYHALGASHRHIHSAPQMHVYDQCISDYGPRHRFMAFIDLDEFLFLRDANMSSLPELLQEYESYGALSANWVMFGSSGHAHRPSGRTLESFWKCVNVRHVKIIANTAYVQHAINPHQFSYRDGKTAVDENFELVDGYSTTSHHSARIAVYHYVLKSRQEFQEKMERGSSGGGSKGLEFFEEIERATVNDCWDAVHWSQQHRTGVDP